MQDTYYAGEYARLDWGFVTPNVTGALIASIIVAVWILPWVWKPLFWISLLVSVVLGICLVQTFSRGAFVGLAVGLVPLVYYAPQPWPKANVWACVLVFVGVTAFAASIGATGRMERGVSLEDKSASNRTLIYKEVPRMIWDQPRGWKSVGASNAYRLYYQPPDYPDELRHLVSTHFTWLVEWGTVGRVCYMAGWCFVVGVLIPRKKTKWLSPAFGSCIVVGISGIFSHVAEQTWVIWLPAGLVMLGVVVAHVLIYFRALMVKLLVSLAVSTGVVLFIFFFFAIYTVLREGYCVPVACKGDVVLLGGRRGVLSSDVAIVGQKDKILGRSNGKQLRSWLAEKDQVVVSVVYPAKIIPVDFSVRNFIFVGGVVENWSQYSNNLNLMREPLSVVFVNPEVIGGTFLNKFEDSAELWAVFGKQYNTEASESWATILSGRNSGGVEEISGGFYLEDGLITALEKLDL